MLNQFLVNQFQTLPMVLFHVQRCSRSHFDIVLRKFSKISESLQKIVLFLMKQPAIFQRCASYRPRLNLRAGSQTGGVMPHQIFLNTLRLPLSNYLQKTLFVSRVRFFSGLEPNGQLLRRLSRNELLRSCLLQGW